MGPSVSTATVTRGLFTNPAFKGPDGKFDPALFVERLRQYGYTEESFLRDRRTGDLRGHIEEALAGAAPVSALMLEAVHRFTAESRAVDFVTLPSSAAGEIAKPDDAALKAFYDSRKGEFAAPEYRSLVFLHLQPEIVPEKRSIERIPFKDKAEADAAAEKLKAGTSFDALAGEQGLSGDDLSLGPPMTKEAIADKALAEAAFSLPQGQASGVVDTKFGPVILRVVAIQPSYGQKGARELHDKIEDQRASAKPIPEIAASLGLTATTIDAIDAEGKGKDGKPIEGIPDAAAVLRAAFQSDVGADNDAVALRDGGFVWYDVTKIERARDRPLDEVKDDVVRAWTDDQRSIALSKKAADLVKSLDSGTPIADLGGETKLEVVSVDAVTRSSNPPGLSPAAVNAIFSVKSGGAGYALGADGTSRIVFQVKSATLPPAGPNEAASLQPRLKAAIAADTMQAYVDRLEQELGRSIDEAAARAALRGSEAEQ